MSTAGRIQHDDRSNISTTDRLGLNAFECTTSGKESTPPSAEDTEFTYEGGLTLEESDRLLGESPYEPPPRQCEENHPQDNDEVVYRPTSSYIALFMYLPAGLNEKFPLWRFEAIPREAPATRFARYVTPPFYHPQVEMVPFAEWTTEEPRNIHNGWYTSGWEYWGGLTVMSAYYLYLTRTRIGVLVKEGYRICGKIRPVAWADVGADPEIIFTTTFDEHQYYWLQDGSTIVKIGTFANVEELWSRWRNEAHEEMKLEESDWDTTSAWLQWLPTAFMRCKGNVCDLYSYMEKNEGRWWDFCAKHENLKQIPVVFANLVEADKKMLMDPNCEPIRLEAYRE
ncbi:hypothetical protein B0H15DRAFT_541164 [Mycena belliarum]|uniref:Uncharacterized protein n=1 Tax=Mycena belliarum TaxID=1033014 RepID=A0AAD6UCJ0_9AGAR|nr:hypothetical protein B0H15DRAFT_541164 [Mycena belliae]